MDYSNQPTLEDLNVIGEMGPTPLRTRLHPMGGHPSDSSSDEHMPSSMLRLNYSNPQAANALVRPTYRPLTTQQHSASELQMEEGFGRSSWARVDPNRSRKMDAFDRTVMGGSRVRRVQVVDFQIDASRAMARLRDLRDTFAGYRATMQEINKGTIKAIHQLTQLRDGVLQTTMQSLDLHWLEGHRLRL